MTPRWTFRQRRDPARYGAHYTIWDASGRIIALTYRQVDAEEMVEWLKRAPSFRGLEDEIERMSS